jgi:hypothetical protein
MTPSESIIFVTPLGPARTSESTQSPRDVRSPFPSFPTSVSRPPTAPVPTASVPDHSADPTPGSPTDISRPSSVSDAEVTSAPTKNAPEATQSPVPPRTVEPTGNAAVEASDSPQAQPREDPVSTPAPTSETSDDAEGDSRARRVEEILHQRDRHEACTVAKVHCGSASRCVQVHEMSSKHSRSDSDLPEPIWWNEIGNSVLSCNLIVMPAGLTCKDRRLSDAARTIGEAAVDPASGAFSASFATDKHLQASSPDESALPTVFFTLLDVRNDAEPNPNEQNPGWEGMVVTEPVVEWTGVAIGPETAHANGRFSLHVAVKGEFAAHVSFCVRAN